MCIIIYKPKSTNVSQKRLWEAQKANPDGWGILCDNVEHPKYGVVGFDKFYDTYQKLSPYNSVVVIHFRTASSGEISASKCHPLFVNDDLAFMQNGNFYEFSDYFPGREKDGLSDVQRFNNEVLRRLPKGFFENDSIKRALENYCKINFCKMVFMDSGGKVTIINEYSGQWVGGVWFSNYGIDHYVGYGYSGATYYNADDVRHKGGLISVQQFSGWRRNKWHQCESCLGYYKILDNGKCKSCLTFQKLRGFCK